MGSGKGSVEFYAMNIKPGKIIFEVEKINFISLSNYSNLVHQS